ncbi:A-kinase-interacting protein 1 isoform X2 [Tachyglossus aculeatus]|nr:A-kinase-interacting protein 1 isoform X2 [Tachyglossus aculeatus]
MSASSFPRSQHACCCATRAAAQGRMASWQVPAAVWGLDRRAMQRTAGLGRDVLERAKRRRVDWTPLVQPEERRGEEESVNLDTAFATVMEFMERTTRQCRKYYSSMPLENRKEGEIDHICRFHRRKSWQPPASGMTNQQVSHTLREPYGVVRTAKAKPASQEPARTFSKDFYLEVSPGTYSVTACSSDLRQTHVVDIEAGQSLELTFHI